MIREKNSLPASRTRLATVLRATKEVVSVSSTAETLRLDRRRAAKLLSQWREQGWLRRVGHGIYVSVPLDLVESEQVVGDPWILVPSLFGQSYIGGWTAAHHWELTEQLFNETIIFTTRRVTNKRLTAQGVVFLVHQTPENRVFGMKTLWRGSTRVTISDAARTLIDMIAMPEIGGGIDHVYECLNAYLGDKSSDRKLLIQYAEQFGNGAIFKRLGFLAETYIHDQELVVACHKRLTQGYAKLDPTLSGNKLVTAWKLWVPARWKAKEA